MKYNIGDKVRVVNYGHYIFTYNKETDKFYARDMLPGIVGKEGIISFAKITQNIPQYSIEGFSGKQSWYDEDQLELIV